MINSDGALRMRRLLGALLVGCLTLGLSGCLVTAVSNETRSGTYVSTNTFNQIKPGQTSEAWVRATLGAPNSETALPEGKVLKWSYTERHEGSGAVFLIFGGHSEKEVSHTAFVEVHKGIVTNAWRD